MNFLLKNGNSLELLKELDDDSIGSLVTDPPYLINFLGNDWDKKEENIAGNKDFWELVLSKMKPGAHGVVFGHSRTHHRVMIALEDAGFEIRDTLMWVYGQGFPKNHDIGKAVDKLQGNKREVVGTKADFSLDGCKRDATKHQTQQETDHAGHKPGYKKGWDTEVTVGTSNWEGWGTCLKPAYEPIILVRKPLAKGKTIAKNCLEHGVGGINIDASRVSCDDKAKFPEGEYDINSDWTNRHTTRTTDKNPTGRFPANLILSHAPGCRQVGTKEETTLNHNAPKGTFAGGELDRGSEKEYREQKNTVPIWECVDGCPCEMMDQQAPLVGSAFSATRTKDTTGGSGDSWTNGGKQAGEGNGTIDDLAGASRFFYQAKVSKKERQMGMDAGKKNKHPTLKPVSLMTWLINLITPKGETCLDPFMGSGSTGMAAVLEGHKFIGFELDEDSFDTAKQRITWAYTSWYKDSILGTMEEPDPEVCGSPVISNLEHEVKGSILLESV